MTGHENWQVTKYGRVNRGEITYKTDFDNHSVSYEYKSFKKKKEVLNKGKCEVSQFYGIKNQELEIATIVVIN